MLSSFRVILARNATLVRNTVGTAGLKGASVVVGLLSVPAYIRYFEDQGVLGVWFTVLSVLNWVLLLDFGVGNGLRNSIVEALAARDKLWLKQLISAGYLFAFVVSLVLAVVGWWLIGVVDWVGILGVSTGELTQESLVIAMRIVLIGVAAQVFLRNIVSILNAMQRLVMSNSPALVSSLAVLVFLYVGKTGEAVSDLHRLAFFHVLATFVPLVVTSFFVFVRLLPGSWPSLRLVSVRAFRSVVGLGLGFFIIQISLLVIGSTDQLLVANVFGSDQVVEYQVYLRIYGLFGMAFQLLAQPVWSAVSVKYSEGGLHWIRRIHRLLLLGAALCSLAALATLPILQTLFDLWLGRDSIIVSLRSAIFFVALAAVEMFIYASTAIANGISRLRLQLYLSLLGALVKFPLFFLLSTLTDSWIAVVIAHVLCLLPLALGQPLVLFRELRRSEGEGMSGQPSL